jgi:magnesium transporter
MINSYLYHKGKPLEVNLTRAQLLATLAEKDCLLWVDLDTPTEFESDMLVEIFNFHPLAVEDCVSDISPPKVDDYEEYLFLVLHGINSKSREEFSTIELDIFLGKNFVVTFHKDTLRSVAHVRENVVKKPETYLGHGGDLLVYAVLDRLVDNYLPVLDQYDELLDRVEEEMFNHPSKDFLANILRIKRDVFNLRRVVAPQRDTVNFLTRNPTPFIKPKNMLYFRDIYDHLFRIYGTVEGFHEIMASILQVYFSHSSHKLNEIMKRMTVLATLTMPSVIVASIYGMNFHHMPELDWKYGYFLSLGLMATMSLGMLIWMKFKKWI